MENKLQRDFTQGSILTHLVYFSVPMLAGSALQALYNTVDSVWVGRFLGPAALGAVSISFPLIMALLSMLMGLTMATTTLVAQNRGAGDEAAVRRTVATSLLMLGAMGAVMSFIGFFFRYELLALVQPPEEILDQAAGYFGIFMAGVLGMFMYNVQSAILRGLGDSKTPLKYLAIAAVTNVILDPLFIFGVGPLPELGVEGAAWATIISQGLSSTLLWRWMRRHTSLMPTERSEWRIDTQLAGVIFRVGFPAGMQQVLVSFGMVAVTAILSNFGTDVVAAFGAASRMDQFGFMPAMALGLAVTAVVGQNLGASRMDRVSQAVRWSSLLAVGSTVIISAVAILKPTLLLLLFTDDPALLAEGSLYLRYMGAAYIPFSLIFILGGVMRAAGDTVAPMFCALIALWVFRVPLAYYLSRIMGSEGIWLAIAISSVAGMLLHWGYYLTGRWKRKRIVQTQPLIAELASD